MGYDAKKLQHINMYFTSKSVMHEIAHLYISRDLNRVQSIPDETEFLDVAEFPFQQVLEMVLEWEIRDSMTVIAVLLVDRLRRVENGI